jgi:ribosomal peptide maturation radical SAM protein 1
MAQPPHVLLVTMPWATSIHPSIGLGLLSSILRSAGLPSTTLYGNLLLPRSNRPTVYAIEDPGQYEDRSAGLAFVPHLYPDVDTQRISSAVADRYMQLVTREGHLSFDRRDWDWRKYSGLRHLLMRQTTEDIERARTCLARCLKRIEQIDFDIVGFSLTFETQLVSSLALARLIRQRWPDKRILFGGSACTSVQGVAMLRAFEFLDVVSLGEADTNITDLILALRGNERLDGIGGITYRTGMDVTVTSRPEPVMDLDALPMPDYDSYFAQKSCSEWHDTASVLLFETSRGCWWGQKHLCSFCGLNGETLTYRSKSPEKVLEEIREFRDRWPTDHGLQAVDNILPLRYFSDLFPALTEEQKRRPIGLFFEIKSNLKRMQMFQLAAAGITTIQPGIESFSDHILHLMDKGATALQQISCIKWGQEVGLAVTYNILIRNPGETIEDYDQMLALIPYIRHLLPPNGVANMQLERYSPYFAKPEKYGIRNVRPKAHYRDMFPDGRVDISALVYQFDFDHDELDHPDLVDARRKFIKAIMDWRTGFKARALIYRTNGLTGVIVDRRDEKDERIHLPLLQARLYAWLDEPRTFERACAEYSEVPRAVLRQWLDHFVRRKLLYHDTRTDKYFAVAVRGYNDRAEYVAEMERAVAARPVSSRKSPLRPDLPLRLPTVAAAAQMNQKPGPAR